MKRIIGGEVLYLAAIVLLVYWGIINFELQSHIAMLGCVVTSVGIAISAQTLIIWGRESREKA